ncbi:MAG: hypothetical protein KDE48_14700 [Anaerolineales bacterium]|nr:hypothetical protein [Anaerolineales bacterium]
MESTPITTQANHSNSSVKLLMVLGVLWLLLAAALLFYQVAAPPQVEITWETATEQDTVGFYLYRSSDPEGEFTLINSDKMISSLGSPVSGANYTYFDDEVTAGQTYYYVLEEVEFDATRNRYEDDMFAYEVPKMSWWVVVLTAASVIIGLALLIAGLKEDRNL